MPIDSKQKTIDPMAIIVEGLKDMGVPQDKLPAVLAGVAKQASMPGGELKQFGNTVFLTNYKERDGLKVAYMRALNADTAKNYLDNGIRYFKYLVKQNVSYVFCTFTESSVYNIFQQIKRPEIQRQVGREAKVSIRRAENGNYIAVVRIMEEA